MNRLKFMVIVLDKIRFSKLGLLSLAALSLSCSGKNEVSKPNVLFIMTDQQRADALGIAGNSILKTPNLDRLAKQGAYFRNTYTQCAVCAPARAAILTGHTIENNGIRTNSIWTDEPDLELMTMPTFDEILHENGYNKEVSELRKKEKFAQTESHGVSDIPPEFTSTAMANSPYLALNGRLNSPEYADPAKIKYIIVNYKPKSK